MLNDYIEVGSHGSPVGFNWNIIDKCQLNCSYCYSKEFNLIDSFSRNIHTNGYQLALKKLSTFGFDWEVELQGGEPTLHPNIKDVIVSLDGMAHCKKVSLSTNLMRHEEFYVDIDVSHKVEIHASYHPEFHASMTNKFVEVSRSIEKSDFFVEVILYPDKRFYKDTLYFLDKLYRNDVKFGILLLRSNKYWCMDMSEDFYDTFGVWMRFDNSLDNPIRHDKFSGDVDYLSESQIIKSGISYCGFKCHQLMYSIDVAGNMRNECSGEKLPFLPKDSDFRKTVICENVNGCYCSSMFKYKKVRL